MTTSEFPSSTSQPRPPRTRPAATTGVARPPLNMTPRAVALLSFLSIVGVGLVFVLASGPLEKAMPTFAGVENEAPEDLDATASSVDDTDTVLDSKVPGAATPGSAATGSTTAPRVPSWSLVQVSEAAQAVAGGATELIAAGRSELSELKDPAETDPVRAERARRQWTAWARIWLNRVAVIEKQLPPVEACAVHAAMEPACKTLRRAVFELRAVAGQDGLEAARARLDAAEIAVGAYLDPPEDPALDESEGTEEDGTAEAATAQA